MTAEILRGLLGLCVFIGIAWLLSENRKAVSIKMILGGLFAQILIAVLLTQVPAIISGLKHVTHTVEGLQKSAEAGAIFVFGYLGGGPQPFAEGTLEGSTFIFALQVLPAVLLVSALAAVFWHWGILRWIVRGAAWLFGKTFGVSGPVGVSTSACIFLGMIEAPLLVRPLLPKLSRGEFFIIMVDGLSVIGGSTMILIGVMLAASFPDAFTHLLSATLISTPMAITMARIIIPTTAKATTEKVVLESEYKSTLDAMTQGTINAITIAAYVVGLLIVFVGTMSLIDGLLGSLPYSGDEPLSLSKIFGFVLAPFAWLMGVSAGDYQTVGGLLGTKVAANEVVAYMQLAALPEGTLSDKSTLISMFALGSFGNFGSVAILIGTLSAMAPEKSDDIVSLGFKALLAAFLTTCMTGTLIGLLSSFG